MNRVKKLMTILLVGMLLTSLIGCAKNQSAYQKNEALDTSEDITITIVGQNLDLKAMEVTARNFEEVYPNCKVEYEYLQNYNETLPIRLTSEDGRADLFMTANIQSGSERMEYALDMLSCADKLPLTDALPGLVNNFKYIDSNSQEHLYAIPVGGDVRGLYVNLTLLKSLGIDVPENYQQLMAACEKLKEAGYVALEDNPGSFGQRFVFPYIATLIAESGKSRVLLENCDEGAAELLRKPLEVIYDVTEAKYYEYKYVENTFGRFIDITDEGMARSFLNITGKDGNYKKKDDIGEVAFMTSADSLMPTIDKVKEDYHSEIEYAFILAPVSEDGGYAYMSPCKGIAINKNSNHLDWTIEFINFLFTAENNKKFAEAANITPNTTDAIEIISKKYNIAVDEIHQPADIEFDYNLFNVINPTLIDTSKANNPKYMHDDGNGNVSMYPFEYYMDKLKAAFAEQKALKE